ncbi:hypothetical protein [Mycobacterium sp.]
MDKLTVETEQVGEARKVTVTLRPLEVEESVRVEREQYVERC